jgi:hypothetical protein
MVDDLGRVNPVSPHFLKRRAREEPYQGRHPKRQHGSDPGNPDPDADVVLEEEAGEPAPKNHIDLRI